MKKIFPKKLWLLRAYVSFLIGFIKLLLIVYVLISLINLFSNKTLLGDILLGLGGVYLVAASLSVLLIAQIILLFIGIHDNIDDMRNKALDQNYTVDMVAEKEKENSNMINSIFMITLIVLSILFSILSLTGVLKKNSHIFTEYNFSNETTIATESITENEQKVIPEFDNDLIWNELYPGNNKFSNKGMLITNEDELRDSRTEIALKFKYEKDKSIRQAVILFTWDYENGEKNTGHVCVAKVDVAIFTLSPNNKWEKTKYTEDWVLPQEGYGIAPPLELKTYKGITCLYEKFVGMYGPMTSEEDHSKIYEYYFDIESLKEVNKQKIESMTQSSSKTNLVQTNSELNDKILNLRNALDNYQNSYKTVEEAYNNAYNNHLNGTERYKGEYANARYSAEKLCERAISELQLIAITNKEI